MGLFKHTKKTIKPAGEVVTPEKLNFLGKKDIKVNPHLSQMPNSIHEDGHNTDVTELIGPYTDNPNIVAFDADSLVGGLCTTFAFTSEGYLITLSISFGRTKLLLIDPNSLRVIDEMKVPHRKMPSIFKFLIPKIRDRLFRDVSGGAYFFLDDEDRIVLAAANKSILIISTKDKNGNLRFRKEIDIQINDPRIRNSKNDDTLIAVLPAWAKNSKEKKKYWYLSRRGVVGIIEIHYEFQSEDRIMYVTREYSSQVFEFGVGKHDVLTNSLAVNTNGAFIVSNDLIYRFDFDEKRQAIILEDYYEFNQPGENQDIKPGRFSIGAGTTPTLLSNRFVTYGDNSSPMKVWVHDQLDLNKVSAIEVFPEKEGSACELSFIGYKNSIIAINTYGYTNPFSWNGKKSDGIVKINVNDKGSDINLDLDEKWGGQTVDVDTGSSTPKLSLSNGLMYAYTMKQLEKRCVEWHLLGIDYETGKVVYKVPIYRARRHKRKHDNSWGIITISPFKQIFLGTWRGFLRIQDKIEE